MLPYNWRERKGKETEHAAQEAKLPGETGSLQEGCFEMVSSAGGTSTREASCSEMEARSFFTILKLFALIIPRQLYPFQPVECEVDWESS